MALPPVEQHSQICGSRALLVDVKGVNTREMRKCTLYSLLLSEKRFLPCKLKTCSSGEEASNVKLVS